MGRDDSIRDPKTVVEDNDNLKRCGKCANCLKIEKIKRQIMPSPYSIPPKHATDTDVQLWNKSLEQYPCTGNAKTTEAYTNEAKKWIAGANEEDIRDPKTVVEDNEPTHTSPTKKEVNEILFQSRSDLARVSSKLLDVIRNSSSGIDSGNIAKLVNDIENISNRLNALVRRDKIDKS